MAPPGASQTRSKTVKTYNNIYKKYAITLTINGKASFEDDIQRLHQIERGMYEKGFLLLSKGYEVNSKGQLHMHATCFSKKPPYMKMYLKSSENSQVLPLPTARDQSQWYSYCIKNKGLDPYWVYQQYNTNMFCK